MGSVNTRELHIWCDESDKRGKYFSNFYGGVLIRDRDLELVNNTLKGICEELNLNREIKWQKVTSQYLDKYLIAMSTFFELVAADKVKLRIMFTANAQVPKELTEIHRRDEYFILYYQFFKHGFGLRYSNEDEDRTFIRAYFDQLPDTKRKKHTFKNFIHRLQHQPEYASANIRMERDHIAEVDSKKHLPLQFMDIVLGAISFRLNDKHLEKPDGEKRRGKRTIAKEKLYKHILKEIRKIRPNFNIGINTGIDGNYSNRWLHPYRHWLFIGKNIETDENQFKK